ncbi:MAG: heavy metal-responsive transcriptional regulator [Candidatus Acidiferrales bacterium]
MHAGELATLTGVSTDTLRHYERLGLLPRPPRTRGNYRDYPASSLERVRLIRRALSAGFSLMQLASILEVRDRGGVPCQTARAMVQAKLRDVKQQLRELKAMQAQLGRILRDWNARLSRTRKGDPARLLDHLPETVMRTTRAARFGSKNRSKGD